MTTKTRRVIRFTCGMVGAWTVASLVAGTLIRGRSALFGALFGALGPTELMVADSVWDVLARAVLGGAVAGLIASYLELKVFPRHARRVSAGVMLLLRTLGYASAAILVILTAVYFIGTREMGLGFRDVLSSPGFRGFVENRVFAQFILSFVVSSFIINAALQVWRLLGPGAASQILLGRYLRPVHEDRSFLFIDLADSTGIAERLGPLKFADFKNDFFHDVAEPVLDTKGQIVQYVGDEVMITWPRDGRGSSSAADSVKCFFEVCKHVDARAAQYHERYGEVPRFRAGLHSGPVVVSQLGDLKTEIVFSGDAVNTAARIQGLCKELQKDFLASIDGVGELGLPDGVTREELGLHNLRGRVAPVTLLALSRA